jgi:hypothetical protein
MDRFLELITSLGRSSLPVTAGRGSIADSAAPILDQKGNLFGVVLVFRDISEKRLMESEINKLEKLRAIGQLAGGIAHDFNNQLTAILGNISLARLAVTQASPVADKLGLDLIDGCFGGTQGRLGNALLRSLELVPALFISLGVVGLPVTGWYLIQPQER